MLVMIGVLAFLIGAGLMIGVGFIWYNMAKSEFAEAFHVLCPETMQPVEIKIDGQLAARTRFAGHEQDRVVACSRWPERLYCDQFCSAQVPFLGDSRRFQKIAAFGLQPAQLRIFSPRKMTPELCEKVTAQLAHKQAHSAA